MDNHSILSALKYKRALIDEAIAAYEAFLQEVPTPASSPRRGRPKKGAGPKAEIPVATPEKMRSAKTKRRIGNSARERWALVKEAGLKSSKAPNAALIEKARRVIAKRQAVSG